MTRLNIAILAALFLVMIQSGSSRHLWGGASSYFLHALQDGDRADVLQATKDAGLKVLRIFVTHVWANSKNSNNVEMADLESWPGSFNDDILNRIDKLMKEAHDQGLKLIIALHDRYALTHKAEAYVQKYNIPTVDENGTPNDASTFYTNGDAINDFDNRLKYILNHQNPYFDNRPWSDLGEVVLAFEAQNEAMGHMAYANAQWHCDRANLIKSLVSDGVLVSNGGGIDFPTSLKDEFFQCPGIDVVMLHTYDWDTGFITQQVSNGRDMAWNTGKRIVVEEFGCQSDQNDELAKQIQAIQDLAIPWMFWEIMKPGSGDKDFEIWNDEDVWWNVVNPKGQSAANTLHGWDWPEIYAGDDSGKNGAPW